MAKYRFTIDADSAKDRDAVKAYLDKNPKTEYHLEKIVRVKEGKSRASRLAKAEASAEEAKSVVEELYEEMEQWRDSIPENLQSGGKYSEVEECCDALDTIKQAFDEMDFSGVQFPGMY